MPDFSIPSRSSVVWKSESVTIFGPAVAEIFEGRGVHHA